MKIWFSAVLGMPTLISLSGLQQTTAPLRDNEGESTFTAPVSDEK